MSKNAALQVALTAMRATRLAAVPAALTAGAAQRISPHGGTLLAARRAPGLRSLGGVRGFRATAPAEVSVIDRFEKPWNTGAIVVPQQMAFVVERFGKFQSVLAPGLNLILPLVDRIAYVHSLKEEALSIPNQMAITSDNVTLMIDGVLYVKIDDPFKASYGVTDALFAIMQLAQTTMRSELGKMSLDQTFKDRDMLNAAIVGAIQPAALEWGVKALRYEIRDIQVPAKIKEAMDQQAEAERRKRAHILDSEAEQLADINIAEGRKRAQVLASEAAYVELVNKARGEAEAIVLVADATALSLRKVAESLQYPGGHDAVTLRVAEKYVAAFEKLAKETNTILLPANPGDPAAMVGAAMGVYESMRSNSSGGGGAGQNKGGVGVAPGRLEDIRREVEAQLSGGKAGAAGGAGGSRGEGAIAEGVEGGERRAHL